MTVGLRIRPSIRQRFYRLQNMYMMNIVQELWIEELKNTVNVSQERLLLLVSLWCPHRLKRLRLPVCGPRTVVTDCRSPRPSDLSSEYERMCVDALVKESTCSCKFCWTLPPVEEDGISE
ncbi:hypothetical protein J6590_040679 [Homalodisca vitripennis]|nr:hypothetical protein J6590_040679 [Homalodisca vitripennis]